jgi:hypothetical protein
LMIVLATAAVLRLLQRYAAAAQPLVLRAASYAIGSIAAFWFIERTFA